jgi:hypothetical protein
MRQFRYATQTQISHQSTHTVVIFHIYPSCARQTHHADIIHSHHLPQPIGMTSFEVMLEFNVRGAAPTNTGEGLAFWIVSTPGAEGAVYGHSDMFNGLGIFFDSYDADSDVRYLSFLFFFCICGANYMSVCQHRMLASPMCLQCTMMEPSQLMPRALAINWVFALPIIETCLIPLVLRSPTLQVCVFILHSLCCKIPPPIDLLCNTTDNNGHLSIGLDLNNSGKFKSCIAVTDVRLRPDVDYFGLTVSEYAGLSPHCHLFLVLCAY